VNPKYARVAERIKQLITEGSEIAKLERKHEYETYIDDYARLYAWFVQVDNIGRTIFGVDSAHFIHLQEVLKGKPSRSYEVNMVIGIMKGALSDLEGGFLIHQEQLVAGAVFDSVLEQGRHLLKSGFKDPAAVLGRVVIEDCLRRVSREVGLPDSGKAAALNDALRDGGRYSKPQWRVIQSWLDIGNSAAHGKFSDYDDAGVARMIDEIEGFVARELGA